MMPNSIKWRFFEEITAKTRKSDSSFKNADVSKKWSSTWYSFNHYFFLDCGEVAEWKF